MKTEIHIGELIKSKFDTSGMTISSFAEAIHKTRTTIYDIFKRRSIDLELLMLISDVLNYDFIEEVHRLIESRSTSSQRKRYFVCIEADSDEIDCNNPENIKIVFIKELQHQITNQHNPE